MNILLMTFIWLLPLFIGCLIWFQATYWQRKNIELLKSHMEFLKRVEEKLEGGAG